MKSLAGLQWRMVRVPQKFYFTLENAEVSVQAGKGFYAKMDLGIVKYHFEAVTGHKVK